MSRNFRISYRPGHPSEGALRFSKIFPGKLFRSNNQHILTTFLFCSSGEIKTPGYHDFSVDNHDLCSSF